MDGDGSIQVNHWRKKSLQFRLVIKLKLCPDNRNLLNLIQENIGGKVRTTKDQFVLWVVDSREEPLGLLTIFNDYPPLTSRLTLQLKFMKECLARNDVEWYLLNRDKKYIARGAGPTSGGNRAHTGVVMDKLYFNEWLSGFIEAEGCFSIRQNNNHSFSIGQNDDKYLIEMIRTHFDIQSNIQKDGANFWYLETYRKSTLHSVISHCNNFPLLGEKLLSFHKFKHLIT
jgi:hypothetical protein